MSINAFALLTCLGSTLFMTGLIAFVQVVHYPLFLRVDASGFPAYHAEHTRKTTFVVLVPMLLELLSSFTMLFASPPHVPFWLPCAGFAAVSITWLTTGFISVPIHERLGVQGHKPEHIKALVATNWLRFAAWFAHAAIMLAITAMELR